MGGPSGQFKLTPEAMRETFARLNAELFGGQLATIPLKVSNAVKRGGTYRAKADFVQANPRMRRLLGDYRIENLRDESIAISKKVCPTQEALDRFMAHEMVHQWQCEVLGVTGGSGGHDESFHQKAGEINSIRGPGFVTVNSDVAPGELGGGKGQIYHVVFFERGGQRFGGFSRRPFGPPAMEIIERTAERMGAEYRLLTTTSHDAQVLLDMSRMRPGARSRSWPVLPNDLYESIVSGEATTAALRRARRRLADLRGVTLYHGTSLEIAARIAREGIRSFSGDQWSGNPAVANADTDAIYLTPDFELAARYAQGLAGDRPPAVLECRVSGRHMKKLRTDPMDTWEDSWDESGSGSIEFPHHQEDLYRLQNDAVDFLGRRGVKMPFFGAFPGDDEFDKYDGLNLYKLALRHIREAAPERAREVFRQFREEFPPGNHGFYHIRPDGTVRLDSSYWEEVHQLQYSPRPRQPGGKPTRLPPAAIKAAWVPAETAPRGSETREVRPRNLPCESKEKFDEEATAHESIPDWCDALEKAEGAEDIEFIRVNDRYIEDIGDDDPEPLLAVREVAKEMMESPEEDHSQRIRELREEYGGFYDPYDNWGGDTYCEPVALAKVPLDSLAPAAVAAALRTASLDIAASSGTIVAYHATLSGSDILRDGFKKSDEVGRVGLGGSSMGGSVSLTTDWGVATGIHKSFVMIHDLVNADDPLAAIRGHLESLDPPLAESVKDYWKSADGGDLPELLSGWKPKPYGARMQTYDQLVQQGFRPQHAAGDEGGEGDTLYYQWLEPVTKEDAEKMVYTYVKVYFYANTDEYNPVFMGGDASHFKGIPREDIGVFTVELHVDPSKKQKNHGELHRSPGYAILPAESEYRISDMSMIGEILDYDAHPGDAPKVRGEERSYHADPEVEVAVNGLLSLLSEHRDLLGRGGRLDVRQAMAVLRNADNMRSVGEAAASILSATGLRGLERTLRSVVELSGRVRPSEAARRALAAMPDSVREEVENAPYTTRFSDISERWYDTDEAAYTSWVDALGGMGIRETDAEYEIDSWISGKQFDHADQLRSEIGWVRREIPEFAQDEAEAYLELAERLSDPTRAKVATTLRIAIRTVYEAGDPSKARYFILRRGKLWLWGGIELGGADEARLVESIQEEFGTDRPPFDQEFPIDNQYRVRDMFEPSGLFGPASDEDMTRFQDFASDTLHGMVLPDGTLRAKTVTGLPVHADHPEMEKLLRHLGVEAERPQPKGMWYHGFLLTPERAAGVGRFGLRPGESVGESNWERNEEYDRSLVYLTTDEMTAKGHACGRNEGKYPYAAVVAVRAESLDRTRMEADFDAERAGFRPGRAGLMGYRGRIPVTAFDWVKIHRNGYNQETTPLLLALESDEFAAMAKEYAEWAERTKEDRDALEAEQRHGPSFTDQRRVQELMGKIDEDPIRQAADAAKAEPMGIAASLRAARLRVEVSHG